MREEESRSVILGVNLIHFHFLFDPQAGTMVGLDEFKSRYEAVKAVEQDKDKIVEV
jgi:hypothetical protein